MIRTLRFHPAFLWVQTVVGILILLQINRWLIWSAVAGLPFSGPDFATALRLSLRFDLLTASYIAIPLLLSTLLRLFSQSIKPPFSIDTFARRYAAIAIAVVSIALIANFGFYQEYKDQFNTWIFGAVDDDLGAVIGTFFKTFHWGRYTIALMLVMFTVWLGFRNRGYATNPQPGLDRLSARLGLAALFIILTLGGCRGGFGRRPIWISDAYACANETANRLIPNPVYLLRHLIHDRIKQTGTAALPDFVTDIHKQAALLAPQGAKPPTTVTEALLQKTLGTGWNSPTRIYLIVMESYDKWPMTPPYNEIGLTQGLSQIATLGASSAYFVSGGAGTMVSLAPIITGIPPCGPAQNYQQRAQKPFPTSVTTLFKKLGYKTRIVYGGYGAWQRISDFAKDQGFDEIITGAQIPCPDEYRGEWGVPDGFLFDHLTRLAETDTRPTFTLVMSTSYHPPYALPLDRFDCPPAPMPGKLAAEWDHEQSMEIFSHLKYADRELKKFVTVSARKQQDSVFAITGDHWSRKFLNRHPDLSCRKEVPFILYAPGRIPPGTNMHAGVHMDIVPTLLHLCAPAGFTFPAFGSDLLAKSTPHRIAALGNGTFVHDGGLVNAHVTTEHHGLPLKPPVIGTVKRYTTAQKALAWWLLMRGDALHAK